MRLLIVRHGKAEDREAYAASGAPDESRPLTEAGRKQTRKAARALKELLPRIDVLATSPLARAQETARLLAREYRKLAVTEQAELAPGLSEKAVLAWLKSLPDVATVAVVGHEPDLSRLTSWFLSGRTENFVTLKKGSACLIEFPDKLGPGRGLLAWLLAPVQLRKLGE